MSAVMRGLEDSGERSRSQSAGRRSGPQSNVFAVVSAMARSAVEVAGEVQAEAPERIGVHYGPLSGEGVPERACRSRGPGERSWHS